MEPILQPGNFVFATVPPSDTTVLSRIQAHAFEMLFRESEGWTLIADKSTVEALDWNPYSRAGKLRWVCTAVWTLLGSWLL